MQARALMFQGTGSDVGKSLLVAGLCRLLARRGLVVRPFKPQNMSNNAAVTAEGGEIGRAQALQARACFAAPSVDMNPVLLKPQSEIGAQVVLRGRVQGSLPARDYQRRKGALLPAVLESFGRLAAGADLVLVEGAGSAAEVNLRAGDIANMGFAVAAGVPVVLIGDIDRGGVIASLVGTMAILPAADRAWVRGFLINKFRGDPSLFDEGMARIAAQTGLTPLGIAPWFADAWKLPAEDAQALAQGLSRPPASTDGRRLRIAVPHLARIANFDDLDPLRLEPAVDLELVPPGRALPGDADLVILPGSKATLADLAFLRAQGWDIDIAAHVRRGGRVLGLCGGYQMLGRTLADPDGSEGPPGTAAGLGLLAIDTVLAGAKTLAQAAGRHAATDTPLAGYEMHIGRSDGPDRARPFAELAGRPEGAVSANGRIAGTYLHGLFSSDAFRRAYLAALGVAATGPDHEATVEATLDALAAHLGDHLDIDALLELAAPPA